MFRTSPDRLNRCPHVFIRTHQVPASSKEIGTLDSAAFVDLLGIARNAISHSLAPRNVAVPFHHRMRFAALQGLFREKCGVNAAIYHPCAARSGHTAYLIAAKCIARMDADAYDVAGLNALRIDLLERFVHKNRCSG